MVLDANLKKLGYGAFQGKYTKIRDIILYVVKWYDNRAVTLLRDYIGTHRVSQVERYDHG